MHTRCVAIDEAAIQLGVSTNRVIKLCQRGLIRGAWKKDYYTWVIPSPVERLDRHWPDGCVTTGQAGKELGVRRRRVWELCTLGLIQGARLVAGRWAIPSPVVRVDRPSPDRYVGLEEAAKELGVTRQRVWELCQLGRIQGAHLIIERWAIPSPVVRLPPPDRSRRRRSTNP